ncbi:MAG TPA: hypothetical protein VM735_07305 [Candidatus Kapabacteria bacterium]|nr:hypothetical protein [Candidatus Kapabacteria bacterium]
MIHRKRARFYQNARLTHLEEISAQSLGIAVTKKNPARILDRVNSQQFRAGSRF